MIQIFIKDKNHAMVSTLGFSNFLRTIVYESKFSKSNVKMEALIPAFYQGLVEHSEIRKIVNK